MEFLVGHAPNRVFVDEGPVGKVPKRDLADGDSH
jgi:hypothetical protein